MGMSKTIYSQEHKKAAERLRQARESIGLSQVDAAHMLGKTQSYLSKLEDGQRRIDVIQLKSFAKIYKKHIDFFLE